MSGVTTLTAHRSTDNAVQQRYGFHFVHEFEGHIYPVNCTVVRKISYKGSKLSEEDNDHDGDETHGMEHEEEELPPIGYDIGGSPKVDLTKEPRIDGFQIVSVDARSARLWDRFREKKRMFFPSGRTSYLRTLYYVPEKVVYVAASTDLCIKFFDVKLENVGSVKVGQRAIYRICFNPKTDQLITAGVDGVTFWDWSEKKTEEWDKKCKLWRSVKRYNLTEKLLLQDSQWASGLELDLDNDLLIMISESNVVVYNSITGCVVDKLLGIHEYFVTDCLFYESNHYYVTSCMGGEIKVWSKSRNNSLVHTFRCHSKQITKLSLHPLEAKNGLLISSSMDGTVRVLCLEQLQELYKLQLNEPISGMEILYNTAYPSLAHILLRTDCNMQLWKLNHMTNPYLRYRSRVKRLETYRSLRPERTFVMIQSLDASIRFVDGKTAKLISRIIPQNEMEVAVDVAFSPKQLCAFVLYETGEIGVRDLTKDPAKVVGKWDHTILPKDCVKVLCMTSLNTSVPFRMNVATKFVASTTVGEQQSSVPSSTLSLSQPQQSNAPGFRGNTVAFAAKTFGKPTTSEYLIGGTKNGTLIFWDTENNGQTRAVIPRAHDHGIQFLRYDQSEKKCRKLISCSVTSELKVWNLKTLEVMAKFDGLNTCKISCISLAPTCGTLFIGFENGESKIMDLDRYSFINNLNHDHNHTNAVTGAIFNESLKILITIGLDGALKVWNEQQKLIRELDIHNEPLHAITLLSDDSDLLIGEGEQVVIIRSKMFLPKPYERHRSMILNRKRAIISGTKVNNFRNQEFLKGVLGNMQLQQREHQQEEKGTSSTHQINEKKSSQEMETAEIQEQQQGQEESLSNEAKEAKTEENQLAVTRRQPKIQLDKRQALDEKKRQKEQLLQSIPRIKISAMPDLGSSKVGKQLHEKKDSCGDTFTDFARSEDDDLDDEKLLPNPNNVDPYRLRRILSKRERKKHKNRGPNPIRRNKRQYPPNLDQALQVRSCEKHDKPTTPKSRQRSGPPQSPRTNAIINLNNSRKYGMKGSRKKKTVLRSSTTRYRLPEFVLNLIDSFLDFDLVWTVEGGDGFPVSSITVNGDLIVGACNQTIYVWSLRNGELLKTWKAHHKIINSVAICGDVIVCGSAANTIKVGDWKLEKDLKTLRGHSNAVTSVLIRDDTVVSGSYDKTVKIWSLESGKCLKTLTGHSSLVSSVVLCGDLIISGSFDKTLKVWSLASGECLKTLEGHTNDVTSIAVSGDTVVSASKDATIRTWSLEKGECLKTFTEEASWNWVTLVDICGDLIVSRSVIGTLKAWSLQDGADLHILANELTYTSKAFCLFNHRDTASNSASNKRIITAVNNTLSLWTKPDITSLY